MLITRIHEFSADFRDFCHFTIFSLHKRGKPKYLPGSYRPISLLNSLAKVFELLLFELLSPHIKSSHLLPHEQFGFRASHSAPQQLFRLIETITTAYNRTQVVALLSLDISCAFDQVWHNGLIFKLQAANFPLSIIKLIQSYLTSRSFFVSLDEHTSPTLPLLAGVPQGSILAPTLFSLYLYDIPRPSDHRTSLYLYADDTALTTTSRSPLLASSLLQAATDPILTFFHRWGLLTNPSKTRAILFTRRYLTLPSSQIRIANHNVSWSPSLSYLGLTLDARLRFNLHLAKIKSSFNYTFSRLHSLLRLSSIPLGLLLYKSYLISRLSYAAPVWYLLISPTKQHSLQILQNKALRVILQLPISTQTVCLHQVAGIQLLSEFIPQLLLPNFAQSLVSSNNPTLRNPLTTKFSSAPKHTVLNYVFTPDLP